MGKRLGELFQNPRTGANTKSSRSWKGILWGPTLKGNPLGLFGSLYTAWSGHATFRGAEGRGLERHQAYREKNMNDSVCWFLETCSALWRTPLLFLGSLCFSQKNKTTMFRICSRAQISQSLKPPGVVWFYLLCWPCVSSSFTASTTHSPAALNKCKTPPHPGLSSGLLK